VDPNFKAEENTRFPAFKKKETMAKMFRKFGCDLSNHEDLSFCLCVLNVFVVKIKL